MRILTLSCEYPPVGGGGATACRTLAEALVRNGHEVDVVTTRARGLPSFSAEKGVAIHRTGGIRRHLHHSTAAELLTQLLPAWRKAIELAREREYDVVHCHFIVPTGLIAYALWRRTGLPYVLTAHGSDVPDYNTERFDALHHLIRPVWSRIVDNSAALSTPSNFVAGLIGKRTAKPVHVIPNSFAAPETCAERRRNRVLVVTRMVERKGVQYLLQALARLDTDWEFLIAGDGPYLPALKEMAAAAKARVQFLGFIGRDQLAALYQSAKVFVFPSLQENFPMVLLEAMAGGCAVVTTNAPGCPEVVGDAALLVQPGSADALHAALERLLRNEAEIARLADASRARVGEFAPARVAARFEALFRTAARSTTLEVKPLRPAHA